MPALQTALNPPNPADKFSFSRRFLMYQRDKSIRGRSLCLAGILEKLKAEEDYSDFRDELAKTITKIREKGRDNPAVRRAKVLSILKEFPSTVEEIAEDTNLGKREVVEVLNLLKAENVIVEKQQPHWQAAGDHYRAFYELIG